jgi:hypothetical protein
MNNDKYIELMHADIDGSITRQEKQTLGKFLAENPDQQAIYNNLVKLAEALDRVDRVEPPADLKTNILNSIKAGKSGSKIKENLIEKIINLSKFRLSTRPAYSFASGFLLAACILVVIFVGIMDESKIDTAQLTGTMIPKESIEALDSVNSLDINLEGVSGTIKAGKIDKIVIVDLSLESQFGINVILGHNSSDLGFRSLSQHSDDSDNMMINDAEIRIKHKGTNKYYITYNIYSGVRPEINLKIISDSLLYKGSIHIE